MRHKLLNKEYYNIINTHGDKDDRNYASEPQLKSFDSVV